VPATQRWHDLAFALARAEKQSPNRQARLAAILHTALHDAVIVTWIAKYQFNRKPPSQMAPDVTPVVPITGAVPAPEPSYPSEHAAIAETAVGILTALYPKEESNLKVTAAELGQTRLLVGVNYRSDIDAGLLSARRWRSGARRAATDGSDAKWIGTIPTGPGMWVGKIRWSRCWAPGSRGYDGATSSVRGRSGRWLVGVPGGAGVAEANQQQPDAVPARHRYQLAAKALTHLGAGLCACAS
jgi:hypothetical protein